MSLRKVTSLVAVFAFPLFGQAKDSSASDPQAQFLSDKLSSNHGKLKGENKENVSKQAKRADKQLSDIAGVNKADFWFLDQKFVQRGDHRHCILGAVLPTGGDLFTGVFDNWNQDVFQDYLDLLAMQVPESKTTQYLVMDNTVWHRVRDLDWHHFEPLHLYPGYQLDNAMQAVWSELEESVLPNITETEPDTVQAAIVEGLEELVK